MGGSPRTRRGGSVAVTPLPGASGNARLTYTPLGGAERVNLCHPRRALLAFGALAALCFCVAYWPGAPLTHSPSLAALMHFGSGQSGSRGGIHRHQLRQTGPSKPSKAQHQQHQQQQQQQQRARHGQPPQPWLQEQRKQAPRHRRDAGVGAGRPAAAAAVVVAPKQQQAAGALQQSKTQKQQQQQQPKPDKQPAQQQQQQQQQQAAQKQQVKGREQAQQVQLQKPQQPNKERLAPQQLAKQQQPAQPQQQPAQPQPLQQQQQPPPQVAAAQNQQQPQQQPVVPQARPAPAATAAALPVAGGAAAAAVPGDKVLLELFIMSMCPDAAFCESFFAPIVARFQSFVHVRTEYIANVRGDMITCMHGHGECAGNAFQLCVQRNTPAAHNYDWFYKFIMCAQGGLPYAPFMQSTCLDKVGITGPERDAINACAGSEGWQLLKDSSSTSYSRGAVKSCTVAIDGQRHCVHDGGVWYGCPPGADGSEEDFVRALCNAARRRTGKDPAACADVPEVFLRKGP